MHIQKAILASVACFCCFTRASESSKPNHHTSSPTNTDTTSKSSTHPPEAGPSFEGFQVYTLESLNKPTLQTVPQGCKTALAARIHCNRYVSTWTNPSYHGPLNKTKVTSVCAKSCGESLENYFKQVSKNCSSVGNINNHVPELVGGRMWAGYNETCLRQPKKHEGEYCNGMSLGFLSHDLNP